MTQGQSTRRKVSRRPKRKLRSESAGPRERLRKTRRHIAGPATGAQILRAVGATAEDMRIVDEVLAKLAAKRTTTRRRTKQR